MRYPDFLGIGAQKAGTTWLYERLKRHPKVWMPWVKELQYFNHVHIEHHRVWTRRHRRNHGADALRWARGRGVDQTVLDGIADIAAGEVDDAWYGRIFDHAKPRQLAGEITPEYSLLGDAGCAHVKRLAPTARIIFLMRDPIERCWSHIRMLAGNSADPDAYDLARAARYDDVIARARYPEIIDRWTGAFGADRLFLEFQDNIAAKPHDVMAAALDFLALNHAPTCFRNLETVVHRGADRAMPAEVLAALKEKLVDTYDEMAARFPEPCRRWRGAHFGA